MNRELLYSPEHGWRPDGFHACHRVLSEGMALRHRTDLIPAGRSYRGYAAHGTKVMQKGHTWPRPAGSGNGSSDSSIDPVLRTTTRPSRRDSA